VKTNLSSISRFHVCGNPFCPWQSVACVCTDGPWRTSQNFGSAPRPDWSRTPTLWQTLHISCKRSLLSGVHRICGQTRNPKSEEMIPGNANDQKCRAGFAAVPKRISLNTTCAVLWTEAAAEPSQNTTPLIQRAIFVKFNFVRLEFSNELVQQAHN